MKRFAVFLLALAMLLSLAACGGKQEAPYVEETPTANALDPANPIPADTGTLTLTEQRFEEENLILRLPEGVTATREEPTEQFGHITVKSDDGVWALYFEPYTTGYNLVNNVDGTVIYDDHPIKEDWSRDVAGTVAGFPARIWANNIRKGWLHPSNPSDAPAVDIIVDYGETLVGRWYGMYVRLEAQEPTEDTNIYNLLYLRHVRAVLNNFEVITTPDGKTLSAGGITATFPARWEVKQGENGFVTFFHSNELTGGLNFNTVNGGDPAELRSRSEGVETFSKTFNGKEYLARIDKAGDEENPTYNMTLYSGFSDDRSLKVYFNIRGFQPDDYKALLDNEMIADVLNSISIDPSGYHEPGTASENGYNTDRGVFTGYDGSDTALEIPAVIGGYDTEVIGHDSLSGNTAITSVVIPEGVVTIGPSAFEGCSNLETVTFPSTLMEIDQNAFRECPKLRDVTLPEGCVTVLNSAFKESGTGSFSGPGAYYGSHCFDSAAFETVSLGAGADLSGEYIFTNSTLKEVNLAEGITELGHGAFSNCRELHKINLPSTITKLGESCFVNMGGLQINLPEGIEEIPESCFNSTTLDVLVIPESVTKIGDYATYGAACIVIQNPKVEIGTHAITADYVFLQNAKEYVFPSDHESMIGSCLYLDGIYDPKDIQGDFYNGTAFSYQIYLPSDATEEQSAALDDYLLSIGCQDIAWIGSAKDFLPEDTLGFQMDGNNIVGYEGDSEKLTIPNYTLRYDNGWWITGNVFGIEDEAFKGSSFTAAYFRGQCGDGTGARILDGNTALKDIWFNTLFLSEAQNGYYDPQTFAGIPGDVTVHLPASFTDAQRSEAENLAHSVGIPDTAAFDYYSLS